MKAKHPVLDLQLARPRRKLVASLAEFSFPSELLKVF